MTANILPFLQPELELSKVLALIGQPARIKILLVIAAQEACVCHLEAVSGMRQASISQHLIVLRKAGLVATTRVGRNIFYRLERPETIEVLNQAARLAGIPSEELQALARRPVCGCPCPQCNPERAADITCSTLRAQATASKKAGRR